MEILMPFDLLFVVLFYDYSQLVSVFIPLSMWHYQRFQVVK